MDEIEKRIVERIDQAAEARKITGQYQAKYSKPEYIAFMDSLIRSEKRSYKDE